MSSPLPGVVGEADPPSFITGAGAAAMADCSSLPPSVSTRGVEQAHSTSTAAGPGDDDLKLSTNLPLYK